MKPSIPIPSKLASRPRWHGLPIPYIATIKPDGEPDFRVTDEMQRQRVLFERRCQLCGEPLGRNLFFTGGPETARVTTYFEPPAHLDCLIYAMQVCPFIAGKMEHAPVEEVQRDNPHLKVMVDETYSTVKSEHWVIVKARGFELVQTKGGTILVQPKPVISFTNKLHAPTMDAAAWRRVHKELFHA